MGYNGTGFFPLWDITEEFFPAVGYNGKQSQDGKQIFFYCIPQRKKCFFRCILHHNRILCSVLYPRKIFRIVSHNAAGFSSVVSYNGRYFPPLWDTTEKVFFIVVGYNGKSFPSLWDTMEEVFFHFGIQRKRFFPCGIQWKKIIQRRMVFLNVKCLSLPSNKNLGKICYLNS